MTDRLKERLARELTVLVAHQYPYELIREALARIEEQDATIAKLEGDLREAEKYNGWHQDACLINATLQGKDAAFDAQAKINHLIEFCREQPYLNSALTVYQIYERIAPDLLPKGEISLSHLESRDGDCRGSPASPEATARLAVGETAATTESQGGSMTDSLKERLAAYKPNGVTPCELTHEALARIEELERDNQDVQNDLARQRCEWETALEEAQAIIVKLEAENKRLRDDIKAGDDAWHGQEEEYHHKHIEAQDTIAKLEGEIETLRGDLVTGNSELLDQAETVIATLKGKLDRAIDGLQKIAATDRAGNNYALNRDACFMVARSILSDLSPDGGKK